MKIKRITIHGFKSFVDKVTLNFSVGTSGIIGPNGCGKSNIVDAIRWVIGEQNARHLRGKNMEDVIFNGSDVRKPMGMAEVVLTFSNDDGTAPARFVDFAEIEVARRLYRSGESEYYLNKVQCRLRDIVELFTDTGIGGRAYSIVEQGQVGWLVNAKPEERRVIFEEAAGINKFKHKKEAALRRLEATRENLTRVSDIISEVKRQLNSLNRQAKKAERYKALRDEFKDVDLKISSMEFARMELSLSDMTKRLEGIKDSEIELNAGITAKDAAFGGIKLDYLNAENEFKNAREKVFGLEKAVQSEEHAFQLTSARIEEINRDAQRLSREVDELLRGKDAAASDIERLKTAIDEHARLTEDGTKKAIENGERLDAVSRTLREKEALERQENTESLKLSARAADIRHALQTCLKDEDYHRVKEARAKAELEDVLKALASKEEPQRGLRDALQAAKDKKSAEEASAAEVKSRLELLEKAAAAKEEDFRALKDNHARSSARLSSLEEMEKSLENIGAGAKAILRKEDKNGVLGLLADVIETNPGYEKAVEAVMGERLQYVIVESHREGMEAVEYLKSTGSGRGSFVPVKDARPFGAPVLEAAAFSHRFSALGARELIGEVRIKDGYHGIVNFLLGDAVVVDELKTALELWNENSLPSKTIATLSGEVVDAQGVITGGAATGFQGILQKRSEIKNTKAAVTELGERLPALEAELRAAESGIAGAKARLEEFREGFHAIEIERVGLEAELKRQEADSLRLSGARDALMTEVEDAASKMTAVAAKKAELSAERDAVEKDLAARGEKISEIRKELAAVAVQKEKINEEHTGVRIALAQAKERLDALKKELVRQERAAADIQARGAVRREQIDAGRAEAGEKAKAAEGIKARVEGLLKEIDGAKKGEVERNEELSVLTGRMNAIEAEITGLKERLSECAELRGELTIEIRETELGLSNHAEKVTEKYGIDIRNAAPPEEGADKTALGALRDELREKMHALGEVSLSALEEFNDLERRHDFLLEQQADLTKSVDSLMGAITRINRTTRERFQTAFDEINKKFSENFPRFFSGGRAELRLTESDDVLEAGVEIAAQPPGKRLQNIALLSGGEKALTATSLIFSIFLIKPSPFCLLDEVDAPLDDANIDRFNVFVKEMSAITQFLLITHNKRTMEMADALYGITMQEPGVSKIVTVRF
ncbi:MAG: chromosome segregation protein SMC [Deltaproteobacteria bacterium]|nr:chromosome segregation protein SMC [Deltaproteobacteria bacterium]